MSSSEGETSHKILDNDVRDNGVHEMYTRELAGGYFPSTKNKKDQFTTDPETQKPYNEWKTENPHLFSPQDPRFDNRPLVSNLGQNIEQMNSYIPHNTTMENLRKEPYISRRHENTSDRLLSNIGNIGSPRMMENPYMPQNHYYDPQYTRANYDLSPKVSPRYQPDLFPKQRILYQTMPDQNYMRHDFVPQYNWASPKPQFLNHTCPCDTSHSKHKQKEMRKAEKLKNKQISDLYRIVWLQNEQLAMLQNQVKKLIELNLKNEDSQQKEQEVNKKYIKGTKEMRTFNLSVIEENQNITEKVSVGIMTSFVENGVAKKVEKGRKKNKTKKEESSESTSSESSDYSEDNELVLKPIKNLNRSKKKARDDSFTLNGVEIPTVIDNIPSPQNSFHLDMQDYNSSSSATDESDTTESESEDEKPQVGWTFYDNVVGKVNNMLQKSDQNSDDEIRNATVDQLKKLGISFAEPDNAASKRVTFGHGYKEIQNKLHADSDTSMRMNALASKYLNAETSAGKIERPRDMDKPQSNTNLSFATMRYLERYRLVPKEKPINEESEIKKSKTKKKKKDEKKTKKIKSSKTDKILDITAIKQQPKLLPKNY